MRADPTARGRGWAAAVAVGLLVLLTPDGAGAQDGPGELAVDHVATYRVVPEDGVVEVEFAYVFENLSSTLEFPGFFESLPVDAADVEAQSGGRSLEIAAGAPADGFVPWLVVFPTDLGPGRTRELTLSWRIVPTSSTDAVIVEDGSVAFDAFAGGTPDGRDAVLVVDAPADYRSVGEEVLPDTETPSSARYVLAPVEPYELVPVVLERSAALERRELSDSPSLVVAGSSDDWIDTVVGVVPDLIVDLDRWFGPRAAPLEIRQRPRASATSVVEPADDLPVVAVPVEVSPADLADALARAWLSDVELGEDWMEQGLPAAFAAEVTGDPVAVAGAARVMDPLVEQMGAEGVRAVVDVLRADTISYPGSSVDPAVQEPGWRRLLDVFENIGGADADALFRAFVVDSADHAALDERLSARIDHAALAERAGEWSLPPMLRTAMAGWDFDTYRSRQAPVSDTVATRDALRQWAAEIGLAFGSLSRSSFENATVDMAATDAILAEQAEALAAIDEAHRLVEGDQGLLAWLGLLGSDPHGALDEVTEYWDEGDYGRATDEAHDLSHDVEGAVGRGTLRLVLPAVAVMLLTFGVRRGLRVHRSRAQSAVSVE